MNLLDIIKQLKLCNYQCEAGPLEKNTAFLELKKAAQKELEEVKPSTSPNKSSPKSLCDTCLVSDCTLHAHLGIEAIKCLRYKFVRSETSGS